MVNNFFYNILVFIIINVHAQICPLSKSKFSLWSIKSDRLNLVAPASPVHRGRYRKNWDRNGWPGSEKQMYYGCPCTVYFVISFQRCTLLHMVDFNFRIFVQMKMWSELKTLEWWILRLTLDLLFFFISRLTYGCTCILNSV